jgi:hypothetical protein
MRTVETLMSGRKLITTNAHVKESELYHPTRVHIISRADPRIPQAFFESTFEPIPEDVRQRYSLTRWVLDLVGGPARVAPAHDRRG